jgi:DNA (cytosine-5)-methyltransferase 1
MVARMIPFKLLDLFSGIGGFSLGLERSGGFKTVAFCEIDPFCRRVLKKHWPEVPQYDDVRTLTADRLAADGIAVDAICGGFPCQDISVAGNGAGLAGERSGLWFEYARIVGELRPQYVIVENVGALLSRGLDAVLGSLASLGYDAEWHCIPASYVGAPHIRDRVWIVAYPNEGGACGLVEGVDFGAHGQGWTRGQADLLARDPFRGNNLRPQPLVRRMDDGISDRVDRVGALGNAVVPQIPEFIGRAIVSSVRRSERFPVSWWRD